MTKPIHFTGDPEADAFLGESPLALLIGFVLDQQVTVQKAFSSPLELSKRLGVRPAGWEEFAPTWHSLGDVDSPQALVEYQAAKRAHKAALRSRQTT